MREVTAATVGAASGVLQTARHTGTTLATGLLGLIFGAALDGRELRLLGAVLTGLSLLVLVAAVTARPAR